MQCVSYKLQTFFATKQCGVMGFGNPPMKLGLEIVRHLIQRCVGEAYRKQGSLFA
jgi:hypothetical protein